MTKVICCGAHMLTASGPHRVLALNFFKGPHEKGGSFINLNQTCDFWRPETLFLQQELIYYEGGWLEGSAQDTRKSMQQQGLSPASHSPHILSGTALPLANIWK